MPKVRLSIRESNCRGGYLKKGQEFVVEDLCPPICHELWNSVYPSVYTLLNGGSLDYSEGKAKAFDAKCPDEGRVLIHGEVIEEQNKERQIILLNGPSSSGKSTLARALQELIFQKGYGRYEVISIDDFLKISPTESIYEDDVFDISSDMCKRALEVLAAGSGVVMDHVITSERIFDQLTESLSSYPMRSVHITCPSDILKQRELARGNRCVGSAEASAAYLFPKEDYDLVVDTGTKSPAENALLIVKALF